MMQFTNALSTMKTPFSQNLWLKGFIFSFLTIWTATFIHTSEMANWMLENILVFVFLGYLTITYKSYKMSDLSYFLITIYLSLHVYGSLHSYADNPFGSWLMEILNGSRNNYDRIVHFSFGLLLSYPMRELFLNRLNMKPFSSLLLPVEITLSLSGFYEIIEWAVADIFFKEQGVAYLGSQGDIWDAQKDMALATLGAVIAMILTQLISKKFRK